MQGGPDCRECAERWLAKAARANLQADSLLEWSTAVMEVSEKCRLNDLWPRLIKILTESEVSTKKQIIGGSEKAEGPASWLRVQGGSDRLNCFERSCAKTGGSNLPMNSLCERSTRDI